MAWGEFFSRGAKHLGWRDGKLDAKDISFSLIMFFFGWSIVLPVFSIRINDITGDPFVTGLIFSIWGFVCLFLDVPLGVFSDRVNKKMLLQLSMIGYTIITFLYTVISDVPSLVVLRIIHSIIGCAFWISSWGILRQYTDKEHREKELGEYTSIRSAVEVIGPLLGATLVMLFGWAMPFYILSASCFITLVLISKLKIKPVEHKKDGLLKKEMKDFFKGGKKTWGLLFGIVIIFSLAAGFGSFLPIVMEESGLN
jgi:DHA3 family macrolide efflux protein-like MFS transporter